MSVLELTQSNFDETISNNDIVIIDFWAPWCGPCLQFAPTFKEASEKIEGVTFAKVNTEDEQALGAHFGIRSIPTLMIFREQIGSVMPCICFKKIRLYILSNFNGIPIQSFFTKY